MTQCSNASYWIKFEVQVVLAGFEELCLTLMTLLCCPSDKLLS